MMVDFDQVKKQDVLVVGDSEAAHARLHVQEFVRPWERAEVRAKSGTSTEQWAQGMLKEALKAHGIQPDVLVVFLGTNDLWRKEVVDLTPFFAEIPGVSCVWVGPVAGGGRRWPLTPKLRAAVETRCAWVESEDIPLYDGWHPTHAGIATWLERVWKAKPDSPWWPFQ
jgi:lysophospholipase L1-like esterase